MNEQRIKQVLEIEEQAQAIHEAAVRDAEQLQKQAEQETQTLIEKTRVEAQEEARRLVEDVQTADEKTRILTKSEETAQRMETLAAEHFDHAVEYVLDQLVGGQ